MEVIGKAGAATPIQLTFGLNWINTFELVCYIIVGIMLIDLFRKRDSSSLFTFGAAALVGYVMELLAVSVTDIYSYNNNFWLSIGKVPQQFPVFGGLMWGGLTVYALKLAQKFKRDKLITGFIAGALVVTMDILLDVIAIRLDGGFWTWVGRPITLEISNSAFMSVIWVNFLGYLIETPAVVFLTLKVREKTDEKNFKKQFLYMFLIALGGILITAVGSLIALFLNLFTNDWFACIAFVLSWMAIMVKMIIEGVSSRLSISAPKKWNLPMLLFWTALYAYCLAGVLALNIHKTHGWFLILGVLFTVGTMFLCIADPNNHRKATR